MLVVEVLEAADLVVVLAVHQEDLEVVASVGISEAAASVEVAHLVVGS
jgi:hypothetical protein